MAYSRILSGGTWGPFGSKLIDRGDDAPNWRQGALGK